MSAQRPKRLLFTVLMLSVMVLIIELIGYFVFTSNLLDSYHSGKYLVSTYSGDTFDDSPIIVQHPYALYLNRPHTIKNGDTIYNALGYRNEEFPIEKPANEIRVLCLGGSTTNGFPYKWDRKDTWCYLLEQKLQAYWPHKKVRVVNAGLHYATSAELLSGYLYRHHLLKPDHVIINTGGNDIPPLMYPGYQPDYTHFRQPGSGRLARPFEATITKSYFMKCLYAIWLDKEPFVAQTDPYSIDKLDNAVALANVENNQPTGLQINLKHLIQAIKADSSSVSVVSFVQAREEKLSTDQPLLKGKERAQTLALEKNVAAMSSVCNSMQTPFLELTNQQFADNMFIDNCHMNAAGDQVKAELIYNFFIQSLSDNTSDATDMAN